MPRYDEDYYSNGSWHDEVADLGRDALEELSAQTTLAAGALVSLGAISLQMQQMAKELDKISGGIGKVHSAVLSSVALQQAALKRQEFQSAIEEFLYQMTKVIAQFRSPECEVPPAHRVLVIAKIIGRIERDAISTRMISGLENKASFDATEAALRHMQATLLAQDAVRAEVQVMMEAAAHERAARKVERARAKLLQKLSTAEAAEQASRELVITLERRAGYAGKGADERKCVEARAALVKAEATVAELRREVGVERREEPVRSVMEDATGRAAQLERDIAGLRRALEQSHAPVKQLKRRIAETEQLLLRERQVIRECQAKA